MSGKVVTYLEHIANISEVRYRVLRVLDGGCYKSNFVEVEASICDTWVQSLSGARKPPCADLRLRCSCQVSAEGSDCLKVNV